MQEAVVPQGADDEDAVATGVDAFGIPSEQKENGRPAEVFEGQVGNIMSPPENSCMSNVECPG